MMRIVPWVGRIPIECCQLSAWNIKKLTGPLTPITAIRHLITIHHNWQGSIQHSGAQYSREGVTVICHSQLAAYPFHEMTQRPWPRKKRDNKRCHSDSIQGIRPLSGSLTYSSAWMDAAPGPSVTPAPLEWEGTRRGEKGICFGQGRWRLAVVVKWNKF